MSYYKGTLEECQAYDDSVSIKEGYRSGDNWANPIEHHTSGEWAILKHDNYVSVMILENELPSEWFPVIEEEI